MSILICSTEYDGCGHVGHGGEWRLAPGTEDYQMCPVCSQDHMFQITQNNLVSLTNTSNREYATLLLQQEESNEGNVV